MKSVIYIILLLFMICPIYSQTWQFFADGGQNLKDFAHDIEELPDGYVITGNINSEEANVESPIHCEIFLLKIDKEGNELWRQEYDFVNSTAYAIEVAPDGGFLVGITHWTETSLGLFDPEIIVMKTDAQGNLEWTKTIDNGAYEYTVEELKATPGAGGFILTGYVSETITESGSGWRDLYVYKGDEFGEMEWEVIYGDTLVHERGIDIEELEQGGYIVGMRRDDFVTKNDYVAIRFDEMGGIVWSQTYGTQDDNEAIGSVEQTQDGNILLAGRWEQITNNFSKIIKIDVEDGEEIWSQTLEAPSLGVKGGFIALTADGGFAVGFKSNNPIFKFDEDGNLEWSVKYNTTDDWHWIRQLIPTSDGGLVAAGDYRIEGLNTKIYVIKMNDLGELTSSNNRIGEQGNFINVYPVPSTEVLRVIVPNSFFKGEYFIAIIDMIGREVQRTRCKRPENILDISRLPSGSYILKIVANNNQNIKTIKFCKVRNALN